MGELASALDGLAPDDLHAMGHRELLDRTTDLLAARNRIDAELVRTIRRAEVVEAAEHDGLKSMRSWLRSHTRLSDGAAKRLLGCGRALESLPAVEAAFAAGAVTAEQVEVIAPITQPKAVERAAAQGVDVAEVETALVAVAVTGPHGQLQRAVKHYLGCLDPDGPEPDPTDGRSLTLSRHLDGSYSIAGTLDSVGGGKVATALESIRAAGRCAGDRRTRAQALGDAVVQLADLALASGQLPVLRTVKPHVIVTIPVADLVDPSTGPGAGTTGMGGQISAARTRWLACDSTVTRVIIGPESQPLDMGRTHRVVPPHLRRAVEVRDKGCVFAGCEAPSHWCDVHHVLEWLLDDGETSLENSALLCERHHTKVHHGFRVERQPDGRWRTYRPDDTEIVIAQPLFA